MTGETRLTVMAALATVLTAVSLHPLFNDGTWFLALLGAVVVATATGELVRRLAGPSALAPPAALVALLCYLTALFAGREAWLGFVPGPDALARLTEIIGRGFEDIQRYAAPVPSFPTITLVTAGGVGLVAVLVDVLAVRLRKPAVAGLPLLALFSVTSAIQGGAGWLAFGCAATGFCVLLMTDARERMGRWGRRVSLRGGSLAPPQPVGTSTLAASGRRIGFTAMAVAVLLPAIIPELPGRTAVSGWLSGLGAGSGGTSAIRAPSPMVSLKRELTLPADRTVLRYETKDNHPGYLRLYALSNFDGRTWSMAPLKGARVRELPDDRLSRPPGLEEAPGERVQTRVRIDRNVQGLRFVPLPYPSRTVDISGQWQYDLPSLMVFSRSDVADGRSYSVMSWNLHPSRERLREAPPPPDGIADIYLGLPDDLPDLVRDLTFKVTDATASPYEQAMALQEWFTGGKFTYSLQVQPGAGSSALAEFLRERVGYCEQFASAMAVMARVLGIPARVAVGYTAGSQQPDGSWAVSTHDAHAWPELYFDGVGWLRFEPTPATGSGQPTATVPSYAQEQPDASAGAEDTSSAEQQQSTTSDDSLDTVGGPHPTPPEQLRGGSLGGTNIPRPQPAPEGFPAGALVAVGVVIALACVPSAARRTVRWRRWARVRTSAGLAHAAWVELRDDARDLGVPWRASDSPRAAARRLTEGRALGENGAAALARIATAEERARYARVPGDFAGLRSDSRSVRQALSSSVRWWRRALGWVLPASTLQLPHRAGIWLADTLNWLDSMDAALRARVKGSAQRRA